MGGSQGKAAEPARDLPAGPEVSPKFPRRTTRALIPNATRRAVVSPPRRSLEREHLSGHER